MSKRNPLLLRVGDTATVIKAERFVRCGYENTPQIAAEQILAEHGERIMSFLNGIGLNGFGYRKHDGFSFHAKPDAPLDPDRRGIASLLSALGYLKVSTDGFGGKHRQIFTEPCSVMSGATVRVLETKQVMTGEYFSPSGGTYTSYDGGMEYDYEPGGLKNQKNNRIIRVTIAAGWWDEPLQHPHQKWDGLWIPADFCEKIHTPAGDISDDN